MEFKQVSKVVWKRPHRQLVTPRGCEWIRPILTLFNTGLLEPTLVSFQNGISRFLYSTSVCPATDKANRQDIQTTLHVTSVAIGCIDSTLCMMWPKTQLKLSFVWRRQTVVCWGN